MNTLIITNQEFKKSILKNNNLNNVHDKLCYDIYYTLKSEHLLISKKGWVKNSIQQDVSEKIDLIILDISNDYSTDFPTEEEAEVLEEDLINELSKNDATRESLKMIIKKDPEVESSISKNTYYINRNTYSL